MYEFEDPSFLIILIYSICDLNLYWWRNWWLKFSKNFSRGHWSLPKFRTVLHVGVLHSDQERCWLVRIPSHTNSASGSLDSLRILVASIVWYRYRHVSLEPLSCPVPSTVLLVSLVSLFSATGDVGPFACSSSWFVSAIPFSATSPLSIRSNAFWTWSSQSLKATITHSSIPTM